MIHGDSAFLSNETHLFLCKYRLPLGLIKFFKLFHAVIGSDYERVRALFFYRNSSPLGTQPANSVQKLIRDPPVGPAIGGMMKSDRKPYLSQTLTAALSTTAVAFCLLVNTGCGPAESTRIPGNARITPGQTPGNQSPTYPVNNPSSLNPVSQFPRNEIQAILGQYSGHALVWDEEQFEEVEVPYSLVLSTDSWAENPQAQGQQFIRIDFTLGTQVRMTTLATLMKDYRYGFTTYVIDGIPQNAPSLQSQYPILLHLEVALDSQLQFISENSSILAVYQPNAGSAPLEALHFSGDFNRAP